MKSDSTVVCAQVHYHYLLSFSHDYLTRLISTEFRCTHRRGSSRRHTEIKQREDNERMGEGEQEIRRQDKI